jgi:tRNA(Ile)-lysidine synthase
LARAFHLEGIAVLDSVRKTISRYNMVPPESRVIVAVSGGADSVCLLHVLREMGIRVTGVAHFNHQLRGDASEEDERFVGGMAGALNLPFFRASADLREAGGNLEQAGRRARMKFFRALIRDGAADRVALGHTRDDQAETVLFRLLRGSGLAGLAGIHPVSGDSFIRPMIGVNRVEVEEFLRSRGIRWREDASNRETRFARNRIRHELLPQLARDWNPQIGEALAHLADLAYEEERWWSGQGWFENPREFRASELGAMPRAAARRAVRRAILEAKGDLRGVDFEHIERVLDLAAREAGDGRVRMPGAEAVRSLDWIRVDEPEERPAVEPVQVTVPGTYPTPDGAGEIRFEVDETAVSSCANLRVELAASIQLRAWRPGDHYRPVGKSRDQKIKEMFQSARIPSWRRPWWPIVECAGEIVWARGFGVAESAAARDRAPVLRIWDVR